MEMAPIPDENLKRTRGVTSEDDVSFEPSMENLSLDTDMKKNGMTTKETAQENVSDGISRFFGHWKILLGGQLLSLLLALSSAMGASMHMQCNISTPTFQTAIVFALMSLHSFFLCKSGRGSSKDGDGSNNHSNKSPPVIPHNDGKRAMADFDPNQLALGREVSITSINISEQNDHIELPAPSSHTMCCGCIKLNMPWWAYALFAFVSVEASYFTFLAFKYTTLPSASLLDNVNIFAAMLGSKLILRRRYNAAHILGAIICFSGVALNLLSDIQKAGENLDMIDDFSERTELEVYPKRMLGDVLAILGGLVVGSCDVVIEMFLKDYVSVSEYLGAVGAYGTIFAAIQACIIERKQIEKMFTQQEGEMMGVKETYENFEDPFDAPRSCSQGVALGLLFGYVISAYLFNYCMSRFLLVSESALLTLSLLTADLYAVAFTVIVERIPPPMMFYAAVVLVFIGVIMYEMAPSPLGYADDLHLSGDFELDRVKGSRLEMSNLSLSFEEENETKPKSLDIV